MFLTEAELAERWRLAPKTLQNQRHRGQTPIRFLKIGHSVRYALSDVEAFEAGNYRTAA
jgi:hypothetical protein